MPKPFEQLTPEELAELLDRFPFTRRIDAVHLHHTWKPRKANYAGEATIEAMWRYHTREKGWSDIAQHVSIAPDGTIWTGRDWNAPPASAVGHNGNRTAGPFMIEMIGDFDVGRDVLEGRQREAAIEVVARVQEKFGLPDTTLRFHNAMSTKSCPGTSVRYEEILEEVRRVRASLASGTSLGRSAGRAAGTRIERILRLAEASRAAAQAASDLPLDEAAELDESEMSPEDEATLRSFADGTIPGPRANGARGTRSGPSPAQLDALRPHVVNLREGRFSDDGCFRTTQGDVDAIFAHHLPAALQAARERGAPLDVVFWAHGGLIAEEAGLAIADLQCAWWRRNGVYPIFFVWETGFLDALRQVLRGAGDTARALARGELGDAVLEQIVRRLGGGKIWSAMKRSAELASAPDGGARYVARRLRAFLQQPGAAAVRLHAVGHSAGSIFHAHFLRCAADEGVEQTATAHLLAPAIRVDLFKETLAPLLLGRRIGHLTMFTMKRDWEEADSVGPYGKSLLYLVSRALEAECDAPILGLEESVQNDGDLPALLGLRGARSPHAEVVWAVSEKDSGRSASTSRTHGGFDDDRATMNAVLRRVLGKRDDEPLTLDFPAEAVARARAAAEADAAPLVPQAHVADAFVHPAAGGLGHGAALNGDRARAGGARRALCIGIDRYTTRPLAGCVADAGRWRATLEALGFRTELLLDDQATRDAILGRIADLLRASKAGDVLVVQFSGHGTELPDLDGDEAGGNGAKDEALCPYDCDSGAYVIDDDLAEAFAALPAGVNLTCFMDCCHSGTITRVFIGAARAARRGGRSRFMLATPAMVEAHRRYRRALGGRARAGDGGRGRETMREVLFSACLDREEAMEFDGAGAFTVRATGLLAAGIAGLTHAEFERRLIASFGDDPVQRPQLDCAPSARERLLLAPLAPAADAFAAGAATAASANGATSDFIRSQIAAELRRFAARLEAS